MSCCSPAPALVATSNVALTGVVTIDGVASNTVMGDVLCTAQIATSDNGYWTPSAGGAWTRPSYYNSDATVATLLGQVSGAVINGLLGSKSTWVQQVGQTLAGGKTFARYFDTLDKAAYDKINQSAFYIGVRKPGTTTASFTMPAIGSTTAATVADSGFVAVGERLYVPGGGTMLVTAIGSATSITLKNEGLLGNVAPATSVPVNTLYVDRTTEINAALALARSAYGCRVTLAQNQDYYCYDDLILDACQGVTLGGKGGISFLKGTRILRTGRSPRLINLTNAFAQPAPGASVVATVSDTSEMLPGKIWRVKRFPTNQLYTDVHDQYQVVQVNSPTLVVLLHLNPSSTGNQSTGTSIGPGIMEADTAVIQMRSAVGCSIEKVTTNVLDQGFTGRLINIDGATFGSDVAYNKVTGHTGYSETANARPTLTPSSSAAPSLSLTGTTGMPVDMRVECVQGGTLNNAGFRYSTDGGQSWEDFDTHGLCDLPTAVVTATANFVQPTVGGTVDVQVTALRAYSIGQRVFNLLGGVYMVTQVATIATIPTLTLKNLGIAGNAAPGTTGLSGSIYQYLPARYGAILNVSSAFTQPNVGSTVNVTLANGGAFRLVGRLVTLGANVYAVTSVSSDTAATFRNTGASGGAAPGTTGLLGSITVVGMFGVSSLDCTGTAYGMQLQFPAGTYSAGQFWIGRLGPQRGVSVTTGFNNRVTHSTYARVQDAVYLNGLDNKIDHTNTQQISGYAAHLVFAGVADVNIGCEPGGNGVGRGGVLVSLSDGCELRIKAGDQLTVGPWLYIFGSQCAVVSGDFSLASGGGAAHAIDGAFDTRVSGRYFTDYCVGSPSGGQTSGNISFDHVGSGFTIDTIITGTGNDGSVRWDGDQRSEVPYANLSHGAVAPFGVLEPRLTEAVNNGPNGDLNGSYRNIMLATGGVTAAFSINGFGHQAAPLLAGNASGQRITAYHQAPFPCTLSHNSASSTRGNRIFTNTGADVILAPAPSGGLRSFDLVYEAALDSGFGGWLLLMPTVEQAGSTTLVSGVSPVISAVLTSGSSILVSLKTPSGATSTVHYAALASNRTVGAPGSFKISALVAAGTTNTADTSTIDWRVANP